MKVSDASQIRALDLNKQSDAKAAGKPDTLEAEERVSTDESARLADAVAEATRISGGGSRAEMLQAIEAAVRQGTYAPDPNRIAQKILDAAEVAARLQAMLMR
jgi:negative regulator of flagellin synthesis FlgM